MEINAYIFYLTHLEVIQANKKEIIQGPLSLFWDDWWGLQ